MFGTNMGFILLEKMSIYSVFVLQEHELLIGVVEFISLHWVKTEGVTKLLLLLMDGVMMG
jgi:hypothetical protein